MVQFAGRRRGGRAGVRVFIGCFLTPPSASELAAAMPELPGFRRVPAENLHLTLHFLGSVEEARRDEILGLVDSLHGEPLTVQLEGLAAFPSGRRARTLVARIADHPLLHAWQEALARAWPTGETRRFVPHVTLGRSRAPQRLDDLPVLESVGLELNAPAAYLSETRPEGARYRPLGGLTD